MIARVTIAPRTSLAMCRGGLQGSPKLLTAARSLVSCRNCRRSQRAALPRDLTLRWIPRRRWPEPPRTPSRTAGSERPQPGSPPGLQFRLQFNAVRPSPATTGQGCWSSLNRSGLSRPELLMRLGHGARELIPNPSDRRVRRSLSCQYVPLTPVTRGPSRSLAGTPRCRSACTTARIAQIPKLTVRVLLAHRLP
jgi:hypothetical protein